MKPIIIKLLSDSGCCHIYLAKTNQNRKCALKLADRRNTKRHHMRKEIDILKKLKNNKDFLQLLQYRVSGPLKGYMAYEYIDGQTLDECIPDIGLPTQRVKEIADWLLNAIQHLHSLNIIHGDIKPENIMVSNGRLILIDFGNSVFMEDIDDYPGGTTYYLAPEYLIEAPLDYKVDYWAFACTIFELLTNERLFNPYINNTMTKDASHLGLMIYILGDFNVSFIKTGAKSHKYFDFKHPNYTFKHNYHIPKKTSIYRLLLDNGLTKKDAEYWSKYLTPFFHRV